MAATQPLSVDDLSPDQKQVLAEATDNFGETIPPARLLQILAEKDWNFQEALVDLIQLHEEVRSANRGQEEQAAVRQVQEQAAEVSQAEMDHFYEMFTGVAKEDIDAIFADCQGDFGEASERISKLLEQREREAKDIERIDAERRERARRDEERQEREMSLVALLGVCKELGRTQVEPVLAKHGWDLELATAEVVAADKAAACTRLARLVNKGDRQVPAADVEAALERHGWDLQQAFLALQLDDSTIKPAEPAAAEDRASAARKSKQRLTDLARSTPSQHPARSFADMLLPAAPVPDPDVHKDTQAVPPRPPVLTAPPVAGTGPRVPVTLGNYLRPHDDRFNVGEHVVIHLGGEGKALAPKDFICFARPGAAVDDYITLGLTGQQGWDWVTTGYSTAWAGYEFAMTYDHIGPLEARYIHEGPDGRVIAGRAALHVGPRVALSHTLDAASKRVTVSWEQLGTIYKEAGQVNPPLSSSAWVGIYESAETPDKKYLQMQYVQPTQTPGPSSGAETVLVQGSNLFDPITKAGEYNVRLFFDKGYKCIARASAPVVIEGADVLRFSVQDETVTVDYEIASRDPAVESCWIGVYRSGEKRLNYKRRWTWASGAKGQWVCKRLVHQGDYEARLICGSTVIKTSNAEHIDGDP